MIARDNETRARLNDAARAHRADAGELGEERNFGGTPVAVGDRVICRDNDARVQVDNGTRGTVRHVDRAGVVLETDAGAVRELPAGYAADHVEHAYCLTGHGMQGGTVERAFVVASPEDLTAGWSYSALSRARGDDAPAGRRPGPPRRRAGRARTPRSTPNDGPLGRPGQSGPSDAGPRRRGPRRRPDPRRGPRGRPRPRVPPRRTWHPCTGGRRRTCAGERAGRERESSHRAARTDQPPPSRARRTAYPAARAIRRARRERSENSPSNTKSTRRGSPRLTRRPAVWDESATRTPTSDPSS